MRRLRQIKKRDGRLVPFRREKIADAIFRAARAVGGEDRFLAEELAGLVVAHVERTIEREVPTIEDVQDAVEKVLIETGHARTAKAYILYRERRAAARAARDAARGHARPLVSGEAEPEASLFSKARLVEALVAADGLDRTEAEDVARSVETRLVDAGVARAAPELIVALVHSEMFDRGRTSRLGSRASAAVAFDRVRAALQRGPECARATDPGALAHALGEEVLEAWMLEEVLPGPAAEAHRLGDLHAYDLGAPLAVAASALPFGALLQATLEGDLVDRPSGARRALRSLEEIVQRYRPFLARALVLEDLNVHLAPHLSNLTDDELVQEVRQLLLSPALASFPGRGGRLELEIGLSAEVPGRLRGLEPPDPAPPGRPFGAYADEALRVARAILREAALLRRRGRLGGVSLTLVLPRRGRRDAAMRGLLREALASAAEAGEPWLALEEGDQPSRGGRWLRRREAEVVDPLRFANGDVTVATATAVNLVAAALRTAAAGAPAFREEVERLARLAVDVAAARRDLLVRAGEEPGLALWAVRRGPVPLVDVDGALHLVEPVGLDRAVRLLVPAGTADDRARLADEVEAVMVRALARAGPERGLEVALSPVPGGEAAARLARLDLLRFPAAGPWWPDGLEPSYADPLLDVGEARRELVGPARTRGAVRLQRVRHRIDAESRPPVDELLADLLAAADDARVVEYALDPWPHRWVRREGAGSQPTS